MEEKKYVQTPIIIPEGISLNCMTAGNLIKYLQTFPESAKVVITHTDRDGNYINSDCQIACNFECQYERNVIQFVIGFQQ